MAIVNFICNRYFFSNITKLKLFYLFVGLHLGNLTLEKDWNSHVSGEQEIDIFFEQINCLSLYATADSSENKLSFSITVRTQVILFKIFIEISFQISIPNGGNLVIFTKIKPCLVSESNFSQQVQTTFIPRSPISALYQSLNYVYIPLIKVSYFKRIQ